MGGKYNQEVPRRISRDDFKEVWNPGSRLLRRYYQEDCKREREKV